MTQISDRNVDNRRLIRAKDFRQIFRDLVDVALNMQLALDTSLIMTKRDADLLELGQIVSDLNKIPAPDINIAPTIFTKVSFVVAKSQGCGRLLLC